MFGPGAGLFLASVIGEFMAPVFMLIWNRARHSTTLTAAVAAVVLAGSFADRLRLYVAAWSVATPIPEEHLPDKLAPLPLPGLAEVAACVGMLALLGLVLLVVAQRVPTVAMWETRAVERLVRERRLLRARVSVVARPS